MDRILSIDKDAKCSVYDDDYDKLVWDPSNNNPKPAFIDVNNVTQNQIKKLRKDQTKQQTKNKLAKTDDTDSLLLRGMFKDLKARGVVADEDEFFDYLES